MAVSCNPIVRVALNASTAVRVDLPTRPRAVLVTVPTSGAIQIALVGTDAVAMGTDFVPLETSGSETAAVEVSLLAVDQPGGRYGAIYLQAATGTPTAAVLVVQ